MFEIRQFTSFELKKFFFVIAVYQKTELASKTSINNPFFPFQF